MYALAYGDLHGAEVELNIALDLLRSNPTCLNAHLARVRLARVELCRQSLTSCLATTQHAEMFTLPTSAAVDFQLLRADRCFFLQELGQAMVHTIISLVLAKSISDDSFVTVGLQRLGDFFLMIDKDLATANSCYQVTMKMFYND